MAEIVLKEWKDFTFKRIYPGSLDIPRIFEHLRGNFYRDEPISKALGYSEDYAEDFEQIYESVFGEGHSFFAEHKETHEVASVRITFVEKAETPYSKFNFKSQQMKILEKLMNDIDKGANIRETLGVSEIADFFTASTDRKFRGQGLASEMYRMSLEFLKAEGHTCVKSFFTSPWSRKACINLGFKELSRIYFKDFRDMNNELLFPNWNNEDYAACMYRML